MKNNYVQVPKSEFTDAEEKSYNKHDKRENQFLYMGRMTVLLAIGLGIGGVIKPLCIPKESKPYVKEYRLVNSELQTLRKELKDNYHPDISFTIIPENSKTEIRDRYRTIDNTIKPLIQEKIFVLELDSAEVYHNKQYEAYVNNVNHIKETYANGFFGAIILVGILSGASKIQENKKNRVGRRKIVANISG